MATNLGVKWQDLSRYVRTPLAIRDAVHNYIHLTVIERLLLSTPQFLRLQFVTQNSTALFTYPSNRHTRFVHSIGCCHLAGILIKAVIENSETRQLARFRKQVSALLGTLDTHYGLEIPGTALSKPELVDSVTIQGVRLAALWHDIAHPPFSHLMENVLVYLLLNVPAFKEKLPQEADALAQAQAAQRGTPPKYHENVSNLILAEPEIRGCFTSQVDKLVYHLGGHILSLNPLSELAPHASILKLLHSIIDGEVDVDRADFILRDSRSSGLHEFGSYDLSRLLQKMKLAEAKANGPLVILPDESAFSAICAFFTQRYFIYRWLVFHHHVTLTDNLLRRCLEAVLRIAADDSSFGFDVKALAVSNYSNPTAMHTEYALWTCLGRVLATLQADRPSPTKSLIDDRQFLFWALEALFLRRKNARLLWKRESAYIAENQAMQEEINKIYTNGLRSAGAPTASPRPEGLPLNVIARALNYSYDAERQIETFINARAKLGYYTVSFLKFRPITTQNVGLDPKTLQTQSEYGLVTKDGMVHPLSENASFLLELNNAWAKDTQAYVCLLTNPEEPIDDKALPCAREEFRRLFIEWFCEEGLMAVTRPESAGK